MLDLGEPVVAAVLAPAHGEHMRHGSCRWTVCVAWREGELDAIVGENAMDLGGDRRAQSFQNGGRRRAAGFLHQLYDGEFAGADDRDIEVEFGGRVWR